MRGYVCSAIVSESFVFEGFKILQNF